MKTAAIIAISVGVAVLGVLLGLAAYQQAELESESQEIVIELDTVYYDDLGEMHENMSSGESPFLFPTPQEP